ncbi:mechanosensitive ion channel [Candidatus Uhrbacteria bacterium]|nr:mechanosensitive ion channel [Candidatus Uhrbacteria bacterium]
MDFSRMLLKLTALATSVAGNAVVRHGVSIALIIGAAILTQRFAHRAIERMVRRAITAKEYASSEAERKREDTLIRILDGVARVVAWSIAAFFVLTTLGVSTTPFVTAAGVLGLALSIGGQHVTRDLIAGMCLIFEDQYRVGDIVRINGVAGAVKDVTLRVTVLRDDDGTTHYFPNGLITTVANLRERPAAPPAQTT